MRESEDAFDQRLKGYQIAAELGISPRSVTRDIQFLSQESKDGLNSPVKDTLPFLYQTSMNGIRDVLKECWTIYQGENTSVTYMHKLNSLKLIKQSHESLFKLVAEGPCIVYLKKLEERLNRVDDYKKEIT